MQLPDTQEQSESRRNPTADALVKLSNEYEVPLTLLLNVLKAEGAGPGIVSRRGALGPMQLMPSLVKSYGENPQEALHDEELNLTLGTRYLSELMSRFSRPSQVMAAYNAGPTRLSRILRQHGPNWRNRLPEETQAYLSRVGF